MKESGSWVAGVIVCGVLLAGAALIVWSNRAQPGAEPSVTDGASTSDGAPRGGCIVLARGDFVECGEFDTGLASVRALAAGPDGLVAATGEGMLVVLETNGTPLKAWAVPKETRCLAYTQRGIWAGVGDHAVRWALDGRVLEQTPVFATNAVVTSLTVTDDRLVAADAQARLVYACDATGHVERLTGQRNAVNDDALAGAVPALGSDLAGISMDAAGRVLVATPRSGKVKVYERLGRR